MIGYSPRAVDEIFDSAVHPSGDLTGVFEHDGSAGYFYLYETRAEETHKVIADMRVVAGPADFSQSDVAIRWSRDGSVVGLFIRGVLWAAFEGATRQRHGGSYRPGLTPSIPPDIVSAFDDD